MNKKLIFASTILIALIPLGTIFAVGFESPFGSVTFDEMMDRILSWLWPLSGVVAVLMILVGAYYLVLSGGNSEKIVIGRKIIIYALVGFAIITVSNGIVALTRVILGVE